MSVDFLNKSGVQNAICETNLSNSYKGLDEYGSDEELANVMIFMCYPEALLKVAAACCIIFIIIGIPGNLVTVIALTRYKKVRNATAIFIINLSMSDLLFSIIVLPIATALFLKPFWTTGIVMCRVFAVLDYGLSATSMYSVVAITINRYVMVSHPIQYAKMYTKRNLTIMIICIWLGAFLMLVPIIFEWWGRFSLDPKLGLCTIIADKNGNSPKTLLIVMGFAFPTFFIIACYTRIMYIVRKSTSKANSSPPKTSNIQSESTTKREEPTKESNSGNCQEDTQTNDIETKEDGAVSKFKRGIKATFRRRPRKLKNCPTRRDKRLRSMILAIMISFFSCTLPFMLTKTVHTAFAEGPYGNVLGYILYYVMGCINPVIYVVMSKEYRQAYRSIFNMSTSGLDEYRSDEELANVCLFVDYPKELLKVAAACCIIFTIIGIPGNLITVIALARYKKVRNATAIFIISLSMADLLFTIIVLPIATSLFLNKSWTTGIVMCRVFPVINFGLTATSVYSVVAITINRYVMVIHPVQYPKIYQPRNLMIMIICIWLGAFVMLVPVIFEWWGRFSLDQKVGFCTIIKDKNENSPKMLLIVMGFAFPTFFIIICYTRIMYIVRKSTSKANSSPPKTSNIQSESTTKNEEPTKENNSSSSQEDTQTNDIETNEDGAVSKFKRGFKATFRRRPRRLSNCPTRRDKRLRSMILAIMISFFSCHLPIMLIKTVNDDFAGGPYGNVLGYMLIYVTGCVNPLIYVVMSKEYRQAYKSIFNWLTSGRYGK